MNDIYIYYMTVTYVQYMYDSRDAYALKNNM